MNIEINRSTRNQVRTNVLNVRMLATMPSNRPNEYEYNPARSNIQCSNIGSSNVIKATKEEAEIEYWLCHALRDDVRELASNAPGRNEYAQLLLTWARNADQEYLSHGRNAIEHDTLILATATYETNLRELEMVDMHEEDNSA